MCSLKKVSDKIATVKRATKLLGREVKSRLKNQFHKWGHAPFAEDMCQKKIFAELGYVTLSDKQVYDKKLHGTGYSLNPACTNKETKVFHNPTT